MKRQVEEAEEEIDRLESGKKKLHRDLEEQVDITEQLQAQLNAAKKELRYVDLILLFVKMCSTVAQWLVLMS